MRRKQIDDLNIDGFYYKKVTYDFSVHGGVVSTINSGDTLPDNAIVTKIVIDEITVLTSTTNLGAIKLNLAVDGDLTQTLIADSSLVEVILSTTVFPMKTTGERAINFIVQIEAITGGKVNFYIEYLISE